VKVGEVAKFLEGLSFGLADLSKTTAKGLDVFRAGLLPFADQTIEQYVAFLAQCEEYTRTGAISSGRRPSAAKPVAPAVTVADAASQVRSLLAEINQGTVSAQRIESLLATLDKLKKPELDQLLVSLEIAGKPKSKKEAIQRVGSILSSQVEMHVKAQAFHPDRG
jgi:hypothetical protein